MQRNLSTVLALDGEQLLEDLDFLAKLGNEDGKGINRVAYTAADRAGRKWIDNQLRDLGMSVRTDSLGNSIAILPGTNPALRPIALGSHTDTVPNGGKFDGALGVLGALACVRTLHKTGFPTRHPIEIINFAAEEATMPGATFGSRGMVGMLPANICEQVAWDGRAVAEHLRDADLDPNLMQGAIRPPGSLAAYLELHIEQGGILDKTNVPIGIVTGIVGIRRYMVTFLGQSNHAGTTPMVDRQDALVAAAPFITFVSEMSIRRGIVGTIGTIHIFPGAPNVIPGWVDLTVEIRSLSETELDDATAELSAFLTEHHTTLSEVSHKAPVLSDPDLMDTLSAASEDLGLTWQRMASGAGHDAMCMSKICPEAMVFVPSRSGISHAPEEFTEPEHCVNGARVLLATLLRLDATLDGDS